MSSGIFLPVPVEPVVDLTNDDPPNSSSTCRTRFPFRNALALFDLGASATAEFTLVVVLDETELELEDEVELAKEGPERLIGGGTGRFGL